MVDNAIKPALRTALRLHEIGNDTPYRISFAAKGKSGGSFGFMQGDLAAGQSDVTRTFREAMAAAGMDSGKIDRLVALLSRHQIKNPLSPSETAEVDQALRASSGLVDRMDERILQEVYRDLDICLAHASRKNRTVAAKAQLYMALWINMSGPPTKLLTWLDGGDPGLPRRVPAAGATIDGDDMEEYLAGTNYYVAHPRNMQHLRECAAAGMRELGTALLASAMPTDSDGGANALLYAAAPAAAAPSSVTVAVKSSDGESHQVSIQKTGRDTGAISRRDSAGSSQVYNVTAIKARTDGTRLTCNGPYPSKIVCTLSAGRNGVADAIEITVSNTWFYDGTTSYTPAHADFEKLRSFIAQSGFPALAAEAPAASVGVFAATDTMGAPTLPATPAAQDGDQNTFDAAIAAVETWKLHPSSPAYDTHVAGPVRAAASRVTTDPNPRDLLKWLELQSSAMNIADADILRTTLALRDMLPDGFSHAVQGLPASQRLRVALALGDDGPPRPDGGGLLLAAATAPPTLPTAAAIPVHGAYTGKSIFTGPRGFPVVQGKLELFDARSAELDPYKVNTGGGARNSHITNGPIPAGYYRLSNFRPRDTVGMVLNGIGFSFDLDPVMDTRVYGRSLFRVHPDGGSEQTNGCLGVREGAARLAECRDRLRALLRQGDVVISVAYPGLNI